MEIDQCQSRPSLNPQSSESAQKGPRLTKNDQKWEVLQDEIHLLYIVENKSLAMTMTVISEKFGFEASPRKWKMKFKEWGYEKNLSERDMQVLVAKAKKRAMEEGKETVFLHNGIPMPDSKIENFKKRNATKQDTIVSPSDPTPGGIAYFTPVDFPPWQGDLTHESHNLGPPGYHKLVLGANSLGNETENLNPTSSSSSLVLVPQNIELSDIDSILLKFAEIPQSAAAACYRAIDEFRSSMLPCHQDENLTLLYRSLSKVARFQQQHGLLVDCISTYRGALAIFDIPNSCLGQIYEMYLELQSIIIQDIEELANLLSSKRQDAPEANDLYNLAYNYHKKQRDINPRVHYSMTVAQFFGGCRSYRKQLCVLHSALVDVLTHLLRSSEKPLHKEEKLLQEKSLHLLLGCIEVSYDDVGIEPNFIKEMKSEFLRLEGLYRAQVAVMACPNDTKFSANLIGIMIRLASRISQSNLEEITERDIATFIFEICSDFAVSVSLNIEIHLTWVSHLGSRGSWTQCRSKLLKIAEMLNKLYGLPDKRDEELDRLLAYNLSAPIHYQQRLRYDWYAAPDKSIALVVDYIKNHYGYEMISTNPESNSFQPCMPPPEIMPDAR